MTLSTNQLVLAPDASVDLQLHTTYSDGTWMPEQLMDYLLREKFGLVSITDHDRLDTVATLQQLALEKQMPVLVGVEMTTLWRGEMTDLLCYGFNLDKNALHELAHDLLRRQCENTQEVYEKLLRQGHTFPQHPDELTAILEKPSSRQPHELVAFLKKHGYGTSENSAGKIVSEAGVTYATNDLAAVVNAAHMSGGVCLLSHPGRGDGFMVYDVQLLDQLRQEVPIDGLEVYYPAHSPAQTEMYLNYAQKHRLLTSSGSDSHGPEKKPIKYQAGLSRNLLERVGIQIVYQSPE